MARRCCRDARVPGDCLVLQQNEELPPSAFPELDWSKVGLPRQMGSLLWLSGQT